ncbi:glycosyltransferase [Halomonas sp. CKK8]|uniref:glycosyltransferase n=1 Tax=Halomonas sp. CKK8 TaxID=3036127 RepID=UPI00241502E1|nr:glycosyltransferase [Halomonas sp. CKK8]WFM70029.1 glycosyltransferase [Halomonas sp. CKK8]
MQKVIAVVLTYNRKELLRKCLDAIFTQTRSCDDIIVINNGSTDGTQEFLESGHYAGIKIYTLDKNRGAAGGFNAGFRLAYDNGADQVWMMDDDVVPDPDALEKLLDADALLEGQGARRSYLISLAYSEIKGKWTNLPYLSGRHASSWPTYLEHGLVAVGYSTFVSILMPRETLEKHGLPIQAMFIWGEDAEFTLRVTQENPGYLVGSSLVQHLRPGTAINILAENNSARIGYYRNFVRNNIFLARKYKTRRRLLSVIAKNLSLISRLLLSGEIHKAHIVMRGVLQGVVFSPEIQAIDDDYDYSHIELSVPGTNKKMSSGSIEGPNIQYSPSYQRSSSPS